MVRSFPSSDVASEVDGCGSAMYLISQYGQRVVNSMVDRKPVQLFQ